MVFSLKLFFCSFLISLPEVSFPVFFIFLFTIYLIIIHFLVTLSDKPNVRFFGELYLPFNVYIYSSSYIDVYVCFFLCEFVCVRVCVCLSEWQPQTVL